MSSRIRILPESLCNMIAAGEVIERPASVVKELVENSIDAGASEIIVEVEMGGRRLIRVTDDGCGMDHDDVLLCLERHATSKILSPEDLFEPRSLGFRGEALPSIAAVSRLTLKSRSPESEEGWLVYAEGGKIRKAEACGLPVGTVLEVRDLFFNTPARKKFLRREATELGHIGDVVGRLALACPQVQFRLLHQGRSLLDLYRHEDLGGRVAAFFGNSFAREMVSIQQKSGSGLSLTGMVAQPALHRPSSQGIYCYVNRRFVRDRVLQHALRDGYRHLLPQGRFPVAVLLLDIDPRRVDVNVHPTKHEVRFVDQKAVHDFISRSVREALRPSEWLARPGTAAPGEQDPPERTGVGVQPPTLRSEPERRIAESLERYGANFFNGQVKQEIRVFSSAVQPHRKPVPENSPTGLFPGMKIIGQYAGNYILAQDGEDLVVIDQHAAHERIGFEKLRDQFNKGGVKSQQLLFPVVIDLEREASALLNDHLDELHRFGFEVEPFGGHSFAVKAVPSILQDAEIERLLRDVADDLERLDRSGSVQAEIDRALIRMACHGVVRSGQVLSPEEMSALLRDLEQVDFRAHCPHGRPVMHRWARTDLEKLFKRS